MRFLWGVPPATRVVLVDGGVRCAGERPYGGGRRSVEGSAGAVLGAIDRGGHAAYFTKMYGTPSQRLFINRSVCL